jgi:exodeoxyribonuclease VII small subunit
MTERAERTFEEAQTELEQIVERLERGQAPLDEALQLWERGEELARRAEQLRPPGATPRPQAGEG